MTIQSIDNLITSLAGTKSYRFDWQKQVGAAAYTAGRWYSMLALSGTPVATTFPGTALTYVACDDAAGDGTNIFGMYHGGNVSTDIKHLLNMQAVTTSSTGIPGQLKLIDLLGYWPGINMATNSLQTLSGTPSLTRAPNGAGVRAALVITATSGSSAHNLAYSYTNQAGTSGKTNPFTVACTASAIVPHITHSGTAANNYGPELPLASGDSGMRNVASVQLSASSTAGTACLLFYRPITTLSLAVQSLPSEKDLLNQIPSLPKIPDGACLGFLYGAGAATAANSQFTGSIETVWG